MLIKTSPPVHAKTDVFKYFKRIIFFQVTNNNNNSNSNNTS